MTPSRVVEVAVNLPVMGSFDYRLPAGLEVPPGARVLVPYGSRRVMGVVLAERERRSPKSRPAREAAEVLDQTPVLPERLIEVILRAAHELVCPPGIALFAAIPPGTAPRPGKRVELLPAGRRAMATGEAPGTLGKLLWALGKGSLSEVRLRARFPAAVPALDRLEKIGWVRRVLATEPPRVRVRTQRVYRLAPGIDLSLCRERLARSPRRLEILETLASAEGALPLRSSAPLRALLVSGLVERIEREVTRVERDVPLRKEPTVPNPTSAQRRAIDAISRAMDRAPGGEFLLYGITGSGKTEVYLRSAQHALARGRGVIVLVPEISLTHQVVDRFRARFGDRVAVLHSGLSGGERYDQWRRLREGVHPIAIGARSAVFAPIERPGLIVIDEEHDGAYKSEEGFRYHARDIARLRAQADGCPLVLGGATPDVVTNYRAECGEIKKLVLPERVAERPLPVVDFVDLNAEPRRRGRPVMLSRALRRALAETLSRGQQAILFVNRRGFATYVYCFSCGYAIRCKHCDIALVYHASEGVRRFDQPEQGDLRCHYCGYREDPQPRCPSCLSPEGGLAGFGTERLQEEVAARFPDARIGRLDRDTSARKGQQRAVLAAFHRGATDVLVGTQMVAKGHDVPAVTLVGVVAADLGLHFPDFRASERTFQLLTQVAGRAGRGDDPGRVIIQTFLPEHYAIALARTHNYDGFYREELRRRRPHGYPPFRELSQLQLSGTDAAAVERAALALAGLVQTVPGAASVRVLGPAPAPLARIRDRYRWQLLLLGTRETLREVGRELLVHASRERGVSARLVPGPLQML